MSTHISDYLSALINNGKYEHKYKHSSGCLNKPLRQYLNLFNPLSFMLYNTKMKVVKSFGLNYSRF